MKANPNHAAVSPVVGVMLMLVVTIIIAAVVSAFAGGMSKETNKAPQATISGSYSISGGMSFTHNGGDPIGTPSVKVVVHPAESFGTSTHLVDTVNASSITDSSGIQWLKDNGQYGVKSFRAGDTAYVRPPYHEASFLQPSASRVSYFNNPENIGKSFWIELLDQKGKMIAKTEVTIDP